jgi:hypothetical protein
MIRDFNVEWLEKIEFIPYSQFGMVITPASGGATDTGGTVGADTGAPVTLEVGTSGITGWAIGAAGDMFATVWPAFQVDISKQIRFRAIYSQSSSTATDSITWIVTYTPLNLETTAIVTPVTALSTAIPALDLSSGVANVVQASGFGVLNRNTLADTTSYLALRVEADAIGTYSADEVTLHGLEIRYTPRLTAGPRRNLLGGKRLTVTRPLGVQWASTVQEAL